jgi:hypothetical protein
VNLKTNSTTVWLAALGIVVALGGPVTLRAQISIVLTNAGFGDAFTGPVNTGFDDPTNNVPGWENSGSVYTDTGVTDSTSFQNDTPPAAYCTAGDGGANQVTGHHMFSGQEFTLSWDAVNVAGETAQSVYLFSVTDALEEFNIVSISMTPITTTQTRYTLNYSATIADAGRLIGVGFGPGFTPGGRVAYDNFELTVVPEPASLALLGLAGLGLILGCRRARR